MKRILIIGIILTTLFIFGCTSNEANKYCKSLGYNKLTDIEFTLTCPKYGCKQIGIECDYQILMVNYCGLNTYDKWGNIKNGTCVLR